MQYIVRNVNKKKKQKRTNFEILIDFVERERDLKRKDKVEREKQTLLKEREEEKNGKVIAIVCAIIAFTIIISIVVLTSIGILE